MTRYNTAIAESRTVFMALVIITERASPAEFGYLCDSEMSVYYYVLSCGCGVPRDKLQ